MEAKDIRVILKTAVSLFLICAVSAGILAFINSVTAPLITQNNERNGDCSVTLQECREGYLFEERTQQKKYAYDADGRITSIEDAWGCRTCFTYEGGVLAEMRFASGQFLKFTFDNGKLAMMEDTLGRQLRYEYEDDLLTAVTMPNGGRIRYTYTNAKNKKYVTMKNRTIVCEND